MGAKGTKFSSRLCARHCLAAHSTLAVTALTVCAIGGVRCADHGRADRSNSTECGLTGCAVASEFNPHGVDFAHDHHATVVLERGIHTADDGLRVRRGTGGARRGFRAEESIAPRCAEGVPAGTHESAQEACAAVAGARSHRAHPGASHPVLWYVGDGAGCRRPSADSPTGGGGCS